MSKPLKNSSKTVDLESSILAAFEDPEQRRILCEESVFMFGLYYFQEFFSHPYADFHVEMCDLLHFEGFQYLINILFRGSAKTSWAKIKVIHAICYQKKHHVIYGCFESETAEGHLYDIAVQLQTNDRIIEDFGQLFYEPEHVKQRQSEKKSVKEFITANGIKVKATGVGKSPRGKLYKSFRPDLIVLDDFENNKTKESEAYTKRAIKFIDELITGISSDCHILFLCNRITKSGVVAYLEAKAKDNSNWKLFERALIEKGVVTWPTKYAIDNRAAEAINSTLPESSPKRVYSIEQMRRDYGSRVFNQEFLNIPIPRDGQLIQEKWVDRNYYSTMPNSSEPFLKVLMMDPQSGESDKADEYAIVVVGWYRNDPHRYVLECKAGRGTRLQQAAAFIEMWRKHKNNLRKVSIEKVLTQSAVYQLVLDWRNGLIENKHLQEIAGSRDIPLTPIDPQGRNKISRLEEHEAAFERGEIHLHSGMQGLRDQLLDFPNGEHDDMVDALVYCLHFSYKLDKKNTITEVKAVYQEKKPAPLIFTDF
jgi:hypothetical protein